jgi:hypothetical protein
MTDIYALIEQVRGSYLTDFRSFVERQHQACKTGAAEVKMQLSGQSKLFSRFYCVDFVNNDDGEPDAIEFVFDQYFSFTGLRGDLGDLSVTFTSMRWNDVIIAHDLDEIPADTLAAWFDEWFDPTDERHDSSAEFSNNIHSLLVEPRMLKVDFGTAPVEAFWELINLLDELGTRDATIRCGE